ncbi:MAG: IS1595 family transposase [Dehalococcoidia bacterium]|nr:IS1595 family transposase [Dehalococcoidia bacterium]
MPPVNRNQPKRAASSESQYSLMEFMAKYPDDAACLEYLWRTRYSEDGEHAYCPNCEQERVFKRYDTAQQRQSWTCTACAHRLHPTANTIYHKSSTSLHLWFYATYLMASTRCGISAKQLERELGVTYKTAWRMAYLIRNVLMEQDATPMTGPVEVDETFVGGKVRKIYIWNPKEYTKEQRSAAKRNSLANKTTVQGIVQRGGRVVAMTVANQKRVSLLPNVQKYVLPAEIVYTDELHSYKTLPQHDYHHDRVNHREGVYVSGDVHTNTIKGFWSLTKNGIRGVYHSVSAKHLQGYLNEYAWRYSHRHDELPMVETLLLRAARD